jgi:uncharacterized protein involved in exopolysaccharide biosynthesis
MATLQTLPDAATLLTTASRSGVTTLAARSFFYAVFKHNRLVVGVFLLIFLTATATAIFRPVGWMAEAKVLVKLGETAQLAPAESTSKSIYLPLTPEVVKTEADILKSTEVIQEAVKLVGIQPEPGTSMAEMISKMQLALTVTPMPGSNTLDITYIGRSPERVARMLNAITDVYLDRHGHVYRTEGVHSFYSEQLHILEAKMKEAQRRFRNYLRKENVIDVDQEIQLLNAEVIQEDRQLRAHLEKIKGVSRKLDLVGAQLDRTPAHVPYSEEYHSNPTRQTFKNKLAELEIERFQALQAYLPSDRHVTDKDEAIASIKARIKDEQDRLLTDESFRLNELHDDLQKNVYTLQALLSDLHAREPGIRERLKASRKRLRDLRDKRFTIANLKAEADNRAYAYDLFRKRKEEARVQEAMTNQSMVNVAVVQRATPPVEPVNGMLLPLLLGLVGGLALASGVAVAVEYLNRRLRFEEEVERYLELPVLAVIPELETTSAIARGMTAEA